ncbi:hypothetical protein BHK98_05920 [Hornefia porci]|uniref:Uncharacterized protein n=1 Tax=Hornefia porci TaxID=2652292 RepID=A0A1Q9JHG2_9FIRM|nr:DUF6120 family protein [Hornefia porci]OLR55640.1 hypothetical protein BHK98_05920 [Hornefia porci]
MHVNTEVQKYIKQIHYLLPAFNKSERLFLSDLSERIYDYLDDNPSAEIKDIENQFGTPLEISQSYISSLDTDELLNRISARKLLRRVFIIITISLILGLSIFSAFTYKAYIHYKNTVITETETVIDKD